MTKILVPRMQTFKGFTLIEILIVVGLIALIMVAAMPSLGVALKVNINTSVRDLATTIRSVYDEATLTGHVYRLALDLDKNQYWAEIGRRDFLMQTPEQASEQERHERQLTEEERKERSRKNAFSLATKVTKSKKKLPRGVYFSDILTSRSKELAKGGIAYAHIFPHGFIEKLTVHLHDDFGREATLNVNSVSGKSQVFNRYVKEFD